MAGYDGAYYEMNAPGSRSSAARVAAIVARHLRVGSVLDVGCGIAAWTAAFRDLGADDHVAVDGDYVDRATLAVDAAAFQPVDLAQALDLGRTFDRAMSMEVAEHLPPGRADGFVADLIRHAPAVLFSAAIPGQDGTGHVNEAWQSSWVERFEAQGYRTCDVIRPATWNDPEVAPWYAQNAFLFVDPAVHPDVPNPDWPRDVVHPRLFEGHLERGRTLKGAARGLADAVRHRAAAS